MNLRFFSEILSAVGASLIAEAHEAQRDWVIKKKKNHSRVWSQTWAQRSFCYPFLPQMQKSKTKLKKSYGGHSQPEKFSLVFYILMNRLSFNFSKSWASMVEYHLDSSRKRCLNSLGKRQNQQCSTERVNTRTSGLELRFLPLPAPQLHWHSPYMQA